MAKVITWESRVNRKVLSRRLRNSPEDGSFGEQAIAFDADMLHEGPNTVEIATSECAGDIDDFERIHGDPSSVYGRGVSLAG